MSELEESEASLVAQAKQDLVAFGVLYERYAAKIYNYIYYRTGNHHDAEDLTARTFQRALNHIGRYNERGAPFSAWLYRIAHNLVANWHRDRGRRRIIPLEEIDPSDVSAYGHDETAESATETSQAHQQLFAIVRRLPPERQQVLILKFVERMSNAEIGRIMGRTEGAIKALYHRTLVSLRDELEAARVAVPIRGIDDQNSD